MIHPYAELTPEARAKIRDFLNRLPAVMYEAHKIGLHQTGQALHEAVRKAGWEAAELEERQSKRAK